MSSSVDKLLGLAGMGSSIANVSLLKRFLSGITVVLALTAISSTMIGMIAIVGFYGLYVALIHYGLEHSAAVVMVVSLALIVAGTLATMAAIRWRELREMPRIIESPLLSQVGKLAEAFMNGLTAGRSSGR